MHPPTQTKSAATHHHLIDAILHQPRGAHETILRESILRKQYIQPVTAGEALMALLQRMTSAGRVELIGFIAQLKCPAHVHHREMRRVLRLD